MDYKCGNKIRKKEIKIENTNIKPTLLALLSIVLLIMPILTIKHLNLIIIICPLIGLVTMVCIRIKYPKNKIGLIAMIIYLIAITWLITIILLLFIACNAGPTSCTLG